MAFLPIGNKQIFHFWALISGVLLMALIACLTFFFIEQKDWLILAVVAEGVLLLVIFTLYILQMGHLKRVHGDREKTLRQLQNRLTAMEACADGIMITDADGNLTYMNSSMMQMHGIPDEKLLNFIGESWLNIYDDDGQKFMYETALPGLNERGSWRGIQKLARRDGSLFSAEMSLTRTPQGGLIGTVHDITIEERAVAEKHELEQQFYQAQKMEAIGRLAGGIAHDFNNILAAMNGYAEFLIEDLHANPAQKKFAENILKAGLQARELVDQMMSFSRHKQSRKNVIDLAESIREGLPMLEASFPKSITLETRIEDAILPVDGNQNQIMQTFMNLCVNACDAMPGEKGKLRVSLRQIAPGDVNMDHFLRDDLPNTEDTPPMRIDDLGAGRARMVLGQLARGRDYACLDVLDNGHGMSIEIMEKIFEPFFTTKEVGKGTGLGLSTTHGMIAGHQGAMILESEIGQGTRFRLYFPMAQEDVQEEDAPMDNIAYESEGEMILLVEDQANVRDMMMNLLKRLGYEVEFCESGLEALQIIKENPSAFDLVISDHNMPGMTGLELAEQSVLIEPDLPIIIVTGYSEERLKDLIGANEAIKTVLHKPVAHDVLAQKVSMVLAMRAGKRQHAAAE